jgi:hypothetical protein
VEFTAAAVAVAMTTTAMNLPLLLPLPRRRATIAAAMWGVGAMEVVRDAISSGEDSGVVRARERSAGRAGVGRKFALLPGSAAATHVLEMLGAEGDVGWRALEKAGRVKAWAWTRERRNGRRVAKGEAAGHWTGAKVETQMGERLRCRGAREAKRGWPRKARRG